MRNNKKGFTLVELIVVLVIIAILASFMIPSLVGYIKKANETAAIAECRQVLNAAKSIGIEQYAAGKYSQVAFSNASDEIVKLAETSGTIINLSADIYTPTIKLLIYETNDHIIVKYKEKKYTIIEEADFVDNVVGYLKTSTELLTEARKMSGNVWTNLRNLYKDAYDGDYPTLSNVEKNYISSVSDSLSWKPTIISNGEVVLIASNSTSQNNAYMVYYAGSYYYHCNGYNTNPDSSFISDQGIFDITIVTNAPDSGSRWIKIDA